MSLADWLFIASAIAAGGSVAFVVGIVAFVATVEQLNEDRRKKLHERAVRAAEEAGGIS